MRISISAVIIIGVGVTIAWYFYGDPSEMGEVGHAFGKLVAIVSLLFALTDYYSQQDEPDPK